MFCSTILMSVPEDFDYQLYNRWKKYDDEEKSDILKSKGDFLSSVVIASFSSLLLIAFYMEGYSFCIFIIAALIVWVLVNVIDYFWASRVLRDFSEKASWYRSQLKEYAENTDERLLRQNAAVVKKLRKNARGSKGNDLSCACARLNDFKEFIAGFRF